MHVSGAQRPTEDATCVIGTAVPSNLDPILRQGSSRLSTRLLSPFDPSTTLEQQDTQSPSIGDSFSTALPPLSLLQPRSHGPSFSPALRRPCSYGILRHNRTQEGLPAPSHRVTRRRCRLNSRMGSESRELHTRAVGS